MSSCRATNANPGMVLAGNGDLDPIELTAHDAKTNAWWHVIVMPMRVGNEEIALQTARLKQKLTATSKAEKPGKKKGAK